MNIIVLPFYLIFGLISSAHADCFCSCVGGVNSPICSSDMDQPPMCSSKLCPATDFKIKPVQEEEIEPAGTQRCVQRQVLINGQYQWRSLCE